MRAGVPQEVPSTSVNMLCGSGLRAVVFGYQAIQCGDARVVVAGGQENMSQVGEEDEGWGGTGERVRWERRMRGGGRQKNELGGIRW